MTYKTRTSWPLYSGSADLRSNVSVKESTYCDNHFIFHFWEKHITGSSVSSYY